MTTPVGIYIYWWLKELFETLMDTFSLQLAWKRCVHSLRTLGFRQQSAMLRRAKAASVQQAAHRQASAQAGGKSKLPLFHPRARASGAGWLALGFMKTVCCWWHKEHTERLTRTRGCCSGKPSRNSVFLFFFFLI